ncbi:hypothetical protein ACFY97_18490 [Streptomyces klenkii]|uniref:hypothetical protein n=1 Tax=Streptomyces klenkii TaxID=1420899 RepID=UPI0036E372E5
MPENVDLVASFEPSDAAAAAENPLLMMALDAAVPLHMVKLRRLSLQQRASIARQCVDAISSDGDALLRGGEGCGEAFNALARGLAAGALASVEGVTFAGAHWCANPKCRGPHGDHHARYVDVSLPDYGEERS